MSFFFFFSIYCFKTVLRLTFAHAGSRLLLYAPFPFLSVRLHPLLCQSRLLEFCKAQGIAVTAFSPLGSCSYVELGMDSGQGQGLLVHPTITSIASKHKKTPAQVILRWGVQRGYSIIPKSSTPSRLEENIDVFDFAISDLDMEAIAGLDRNMRFNDPGVFCKGMGGDYPIFN